MDLDRVRNVKSTFDAIEEDASKAELLAQAEEAIEFLAEHFPAFAETDRAAVAWFTAVILNSVRDLPVSDSGRVLLNSGTAYALAAVKLLGWADE